MQRNTRLTKDEVESAFSDNGLIALNAETYENNRSKIRYKCKKCGYEGEKRYNSLKSHPGCQGCIINDRANEKRFSLEEIRKLFLDHGMKCLATEYNNCTSPLPYECLKCGDKGFKYAHALRDSMWCRKCNFQTGNKHYGWIEDRKLAALRRSMGWRCRGMIGNLLRRLGKNKRYNTSEYLGYSTEELYHHIINHPNWNNVKDKKWQVDHIFPVKAFVDNGILDPKIINRLDNLQPLEARDNVVKSDNYDPVKFQEYLSKVLYNA